jgi:hypothetical protein
VTKERLDKFFETVSADLDRTFYSESKDFAKRRQLDRSRKRARYNVKGLRDKAINAFIDLNRSLKGFQHSLDPDILSNAKYYITVMLERYTKTLDNDCIQISLHLDELLAGWRFGPGTSNGVKGTHTAEKISQPMSCNEVSRPLVERLRRSTPYLARFDCENGKGVNVIRGSRLSTVPKNEDTERTIAIEPSGQMALQLAAGHYLEGALRYIGCDITRQQPLNKAMAQRGSIDGSLATIDMKSASDMISPSLVRALFPPEWFELLSTIRSEEIEVRPGEWETLHMISTMGNGFTFPLMTLIICSLIYGFRATHGGPNLFIDWTDTAVFGDDVIVPTHEYQSICDVFESAGLVINHDKSYRDGFFRESCGGDYFKGHDVTPFYVKSLSSNPDVYVAINQLTNWCRRTDIYLHGALCLLASFIDGKPYFVPEWFGPNQGIRTSQVGRRFKYLKPVPPKFALPEGSPFLMMLACGGYVESFGPHAFYTPRPSGRNRLSYVVRESRLPKGFLEGWDPGLGSHRSSIYISVWLDSVFR